MVENPDGISRIHERKNSNLRPVPSGRRDFLLDMRDHARDAGRGDAAAVEDVEA